MQSKKRAIRVLVTYAEPDAHTARQIFDALGREIDPDSVNLALWELPGSSDEVDGISATWPSYDGIIVCLSDDFCQALSQSGVSEAFLTHCTAKGEAHPKVMTLMLQASPLSAEAKTLANLDNFPNQHMLLSVEQLAQGPCAVAKALRGAFIQTLSTAYSPASFPLEASQVPSGHCIFAPYDTLLEQLTCIEPKPDTRNYDDVHILKHIVSTVGAQLGYVLDVETGKPLLDHLLDGAGFDESTADIHRSLKSQILDFDRCTRTLSLDQVPLLGGRMQARCLVLPLNSDKARKLVLLGKHLKPHVDSNYIIFVLQQLCQRTFGVKPQRSLSLLKYDIYDALKSHFGYVSDQVYRQRFDAFKALIKRVDIEFERIIEFGLTSREPQIWGWEALARYKGGECAPAEVFNTAELWGERFQVEADLFIVEKAILTYTQSLKITNNHRFQDQQRLCINVYPCTLGKPMFKHLLARYTKKSDTEGGTPRVEGERLVFEISEKTMLVLKRENEHPSDMEAFAELLSALRHEFHVKFALDDFGVGHSSLSRLFRLEPDVVKIDRAVLIDCSEHVARSFIEFFTYLPTQRGNPRFDVIIEGVDHDNNLKPEKLLHGTDEKASKVKLVQGYLFGKSTSVVAPRIDKTLYEKMNFELALNQEEDDE